MIEVTILAYLSNALGKTPVYLEEPENPPKEYVLFEKLSEGNKDYLRSGSFAFQSYSTTLAKAASLSQRVKSAMDVIPDNTEIYKSTLNSEYNYTDTETKRYRYQAVYDLVYYQAN